MSEDTTPAGLTATEAARRIRDGEMTSEDLVRACLGRIAEHEERIGAWTHLDPDYAIEQAKAADEARAAGEASGPLHGVPVGVKDIFDTDDMPTEQGSVLHRGRQPLANCTVVNRLREAGAVIMGKTVTTEFAVYSPGKTRNPHDPTRTPGGSSSGSAAAVATGMVPLAIGTQTNGSMIRPASFCGVVGFKPTHGRISRSGVLLLSPVLDQVGAFARTVDDVALLAEQMIGYDPGDAATQPRARPKLVETAASQPPVTPRLGFVTTPMWEEADEDAQEAFQELFEHLGDDVEDVTLPEPFDHAVGWLGTIMEADIARNLNQEFDTGREQLSDVLAELIERGRRVTAIDYNRAVDSITGLNLLLKKLFDDYDAILTPATTGQAPVGLEGTGDPVFCTLWTLCGTPAVSLPLLQGADGLPIGVQLVGPRGDDARLLRTANWLSRTVAAE